MSSNSNKFELTDLINLFYCYLFEKKPKKKLLSKFIEVPWGDQNFKLQTLIANSLKNSSYISIPNWSILINEMIKFYPKDISLGNHPFAKDYLFKPKCIIKLFVEKPLNYKIYESYNLTFIPEFNHYIVTLESISINGEEKNEIAIGKIVGTIDPIEATYKIITFFLKKEEKLGNIRKILEITKNKLKGQENIFEFFS
jgi:hypothetical protein